MPREVCNGLSNSLHCISQLPRPNMRRPFYFFPDHEPFFGAVPAPDPPPNTSFNSQDVAKMLRELVIAFSSLKSRRIDNRSIQIFYTMNAEVFEHPFFWCWYIDKHLPLLQLAGVVREELLLPLEVTGYRSWEHDEDILILMTRLRVHLKTLRFMETATQHNLRILDFNIRRHRVLEVVLQRLKQVTGMAKALAKGLQALDVDGYLEAKCTICADDFDVEEDDRNHGPVMTDCEHIFGHDCIVKWLCKHETCPVCRRKLV